MKWSRRIIWMRISRIAIVVSLVLTVAFAAFTVYGNSVGNFVINGDSSGKSLLTLSEVADRSTTTSRLSVEPPKYLEDFSYRDLDTHIVEGIGNKNSPFNKYMAFSFYLVNEGDSAIEYALEMKITGERLKMASAMRVMIIEGDDFGAGVLYAKPEENDEDYATYTRQLREYGYAETGPDAYPSATEFVDDHTVASLNGIPLEANDFHKYTVVIWLEGCDPQCVDDIQKGGIRVQMNFYGSGAAEK